MVVCILGGYLDLWGQAGAVENCYHDAYCDCVRRS